MAATFKRTTIGKVAGASVFECGCITFDSDATVEVKTGIQSVRSVSLQVLGDAASAPSVYVNESVVDGVIASNGSLTVVASASNTRSVLYRIEGY